MRSTWMEMTSGERILLCWTVLVIMAAMVVMFWPVPAHAGAFDFLDDWDSLDRSLYYGAGTVIALDTMQTLTIAEHPERWMELNPVLGDHPEPAAVWLYFASEFVGVSYIADQAGKLPNYDYLPLGWTARKLVLLAVILGQGKAVQSNAKNGIWFTLTF